MNFKKKGLTSNAVLENREKFGENILPEEKTVPALRLFLAQFVNPLVYVLFFAGLISLFLGKYFEIILIFLVILVNALMGFFQENKTQKTLSAIKKLVKPIARVFRDNHKKEIDVTELVVGDIVFVSAGDKIPADAKILEANSFFLNEAILTGESTFINKKEKEAVYMGTIVVSGRAVLEIENVGLKTKIGKIAQTLKKTEQPETILQLRLKKMTKTLIRISLFLSSLVFLFGFFTEHNFWEMLEISSILLVAIIPEALLIVITLVLVLAMRESLNKKALIRKLLAVETLGSVTTICTDKTGTLTEGKMQIVETNFINKEKTLLGMCLCNDQDDTLEIALWEYLKKIKNFKPQQVFKAYSRLSEIPFSSEYKFMATLNSFPDNKNEILILMKGAPEKLLEFANLSLEQKQSIIKMVDLWAKKGLKVLAVAWKKKLKNKTTTIQKKDIANLEWGGIIGLWDPPRKEVHETLALAQNSGLKIKVVTGDYSLTAVKIMENLGLKISPEEILEGKEMEQLKRKSLKEKILSTKLFARVTPEQKLTIVKILQANKEIVAMTGDGVNDAPALKKSNIGIVVGDASEIAKETADLILLDNNFKTIISAIEAGRLVFENIKKIILFILSNSFAEIVVILGSLIMGWPFPLTVIQILWLNLLCNGPEDFILSFEPKEKEIMLEGPKKIDEPILGKVGISLIVLISLISGLVSLGFFWYFGIFKENMALGGTMVFMSLAFRSIFYIFSCRTLRKPFWRYENFWSNPWLFVVVFLSLALGIIVTYFPPTQKILTLVPLEFSHWLLLFANGSILVLIIEIVKLKYFFKK